MNTKISTQEKELTLCPRFEHTFQILGKKWNGLIIEVLLDGPKRFKDLSQTIEDVSDRVLAERLKDLEAEGIITRPEGEEDNVRAGYCLTSKGKDLQKIMKEVHAWSDEWICVKS